MKVAVLFSGGKDSTFTVYKVQELGHEVACLVSFIPRNQESYMFHVPNIEWARLQAEALGLPYERFETEGVKEIEVQDMKAALEAIKEKYNIQAVASGAHASNYQKSRVDRVVKELGLESLAPFWHMDDVDFMRSFIGTGFKARFTSVSADGLGPDWLGKDLDEERLNKLIKLHKEKGVSIVGEGGEYETFAYDGPIFSKRIEFSDSQVVWKRNSGFLDVKEAKLSEKG
jgi:ABC transporter with metal-binding/Fe-S-binding domain ATP-binding protein